MSSSPRPTHRWKSFQLGLLVLALLIATWITGRNHWTSLHFSFGGTTSYEIASASGYLHWITDTFQYPAGNPPHLTGHSERLLCKSGWLPPPYDHEDIANTTGSNSLENHSVAHWLLVLAWLIPWCFYLLLRRIWARRPSASEGTDLSPEGPTSSAPHHLTSPHS